MNKYIVYSSLVVLACAFSQILLKISANREYSSKVQMFLNPYVIISYGILFASTLLNSKVIYKNLAISQISFIESLGYIFVPCISFFVLKEKLKRGQILGLLLIIAGVILYLC
jgi:drug/metabolite transporter (DMT)-like permease